jgi:hypothetical protein
LTDHEKNILRMDHLETVMVCTACMLCLVRN